MNLGYLLLISILAANYRTISMIRGEPYIIFFLILFLLILLEADNKDFIFDVKFVLLFGLIIGLIALSRQWGFLLPPLIFMGFFKIIINKKIF